LEIQRENSNLINVIVLLMRTTIALQFMISGSSQSPQSPASGRQTSGVLGVIEQMHTPANRHNASQAEERSIQELGKRGALLRSLVEAQQREDDNRNDNLTPSDQQQQQSVAFLASDKSRYRKQKLQRSLTMKLNDTTYSRASGGPKREGHLIKLLSRPRQFFHSFVPHILNKQQVLERPKMRPSKGRPSRPPVRRQPSRESLEAAKTGAIVHRFSLVESQSGPHRNVHGADLGALLEDRERAQSIISSDQLQQSNLRPNYPTISAHNQMAPQQMPNTVRFSPNSPPLGRPIGSEPAPTETVPSSAQYHRGRPYGQPVGGGPDSGGQSLDENGAKGDRLSANSLGPHNDKVYLLGPEGQHTEGGPAGDGGGSGEDNLPDRGPPVSQMDTEQSLSETDEQIRNEYERRLREVANLNNTAAGPAGLGHDVRPTQQLAPANPPNQYFPTTRYAGSQTRPSPLVQIPPPQPPTSMSTLPVMLVWPSTHSSRPASSGDDDRLAGPSPEEDEGQPQAGEPMGDGWPPQMGAPPRLERSRELGPGGQMVLVASTPARPDDLEESERQRQDEQDNAYGGRAIGELRPANVRAAFVPSALETIAQLRLNETAPGRAPPPPLSSFEEDHEAIGGNFDRQTIGRKLALNERAVVVGELQESGQRGASLQQQLQRVQRAGGGGLALVEGQQAGGLADGNWHNDSLRVEPADQSAALRETIKRLHQTKARIRQLQAELELDQRANRAPPPASMPEWTAGRERMAVAPSAESVSTPTRLAFEPASTAAPPAARSEAEPARVVPGGHPVDRSVVRWWSQQGNTAGGPAPPVLAERARPSPAAHGQAWPPRAAVRAQQPMNVPLGLFHAAGPLGSPARLLAGAVGTTVHQHHAQPAPSTGQWSRVEDRRLGGQSNGTERPGGGRASAELLSVRPSSAPILLASTITVASAGETSEPTQAAAHEQTPAPSMKSEPPASGHPEGPRRSAAASDWERVQRGGGQPKLEHMVPVLMRDVGESPIVVVEQRGPAAETTTTPSPSTTTPPLSSRGNPRLSKQLPAFGGPKITAAATWRPSNVLAPPRTAGPPTTVNNTAGSGATSTGRPAQAEGAEWSAGRLLGASLQTVGQLSNWALGGLSSLATSSATPPQLGSSGRPRPPAAEVGRGGGTRWLALVCGSLVLVSLVVGLAAFWWQRRGGRRLGGASRGCQLGAGGVAPSLSGKGCRRRAAAAERRAGGLRAEPHADWRRFPAAALARVSGVLVGAPGPSASAAKRQPQPLGHRCDISLVGHSRHHQLLAGLQDAPDGHAAGDQRPGKSQTATVLAGAPCCHCAPCQAWFVRLRETDAGDCEHAAQRHTSGLGQGDTVSGGLHSQLAPRGRLPFGAASSVNNMLPAHVKRAAGVDPAALVSPRAGASASPSSEEQFCGQKYRQKQRLPMGGTRLRMMSAVSMEAAGLRPPPCEHSVSHTHAQSAGNCCAGAGPRGEQQCAGGPARGKQRAQHSSPASDSSCLLLSSWSSCEQAPQSRTGCGGAKWAGPRLKEERQAVRAMQRCLAAAESSTPAGQTEAQEDGPAGEARRQQVECACQPASCGGQSQVQSPPRHVCSHCDHQHEHQAAGKHPAGRCSGQLLLALSESAGDATEQQWAAEEQPSGAAEPDTKRDRTMTRKRAGRHAAAFRDGPSEGQPPQSVAGERPASPAEPERRCLFNCSGSESAARLLAEPPGEPQRDCEGGGGALVEPEGGGSEGGKQAAANKSAGGRRGAVTRFAAPPAAVLSLAASIQRRLRQTRSGTKG